MTKTKNNDDDYGKGAVENPYTRKKEWKITKKKNGKNTTNIKIWDQVT